METIAGVFSAIARGLRGLFDLASMAVGVAPTAGTPFGGAFVTDEGLERSSASLGSPAVIEEAMTEHSEMFTREMGLSHE